MASSCSYKPVATDPCVVVPRTCQECLNEPLPTGEVCALSPLSGLCVSASAVTSGSPLLLGVQTAAEPLLSNASTYCGAEDAECVSCLGQTHASGAVCSGKSGCVCVGICENDSEAWNATATRLLTRLLDTQTSASDGSSASECTTTWTELNEPLVEPTPPAKSTRASDNECMWHADVGDRCSRPRSCYDCLNAALLSGQECTVTPQGYCSTLDAYEPARDFRLNGSATAAHYFPSSNATYCEPSDATCAACARASFAVSTTGSVHASQFCVGADGCVCIGFCESPDYAELVQSRMCDGPGMGYGPAGSNTRSDTLSTHIMAAAIGLSALVLVSLSLWLWRRARIERGGPMDRSREPRSPQFGPLLELTAWKERREELIARETAETFGVGSFDSSGCFYLTPPSSTPVAMMADADARATVVGGFRPSCVLLGLEHERQGGGGTAEYMYDHSR